MPRAADRAVATWLGACAALVLAMVVVGGATRLTHSGLSIVEWQPLVGTLPPLTATEWQTVFEKYQATPEYRLVNHGMSLDAFKGIFWWEYAHRLLGRVIGVIVLVPLFVFWRRGWITGRLTRVLIAIFALGGLQGALGWYMVRSGLVDDPAVSPFRLTAHLLLAFAIFGALWWTALSIGRRATARAAPAGVRRHAWIVTLVAVYMVATGGIVAGTRAGFAYNTFPLMGGHVVPPEIFLLAPWWKNFFANVATVQFDHRLGAWTLAVIVPWLWWRIRAASVSPAARQAGTRLVLMLAVQIALGVSTLLLAVPVPLAVLHQGGAVLLFAAALTLNQSLATSRPAPSA